MPMEPPQRDVQRRGEPDPHRDDPVRRQPLGETTRGINQPTTSGQEAVPEGTDDGGGPEQHQLRQWSRGP